MSTKVEHVQVTDHELEDLLRDNALPAKHPVSHISLDSPHVVMSDWSTRSALRAWALAQKRVSWMLSSVCTE